MDIFTFNTMYLAISVKCDGKYLTYLDPKTSSLTAVFCKKITGTSGKLSYDEMLQHLRLLMDQYLIMPNTIDANAEEMVLVKSFNDANNNILICFEFDTDVELEDALSIKSTSGLNSYLEFLEPTKVSDWENKAPYTEKLFPFLLNA